MTCQYTFPLQILSDNMRIILMEAPIPPLAMRFKNMCMLLSGITTVTLMTACGGGGSSAPVASVPPQPTVSIDVFGARGTTLTAITSSSNCSVSPTISWQTSSGTSLGTGSSIVDTQPSAAIMATATCSTASATETLAANSVYNTIAAFAVLQNNQPYAWGNPVWGGQGATAATLNNVIQLIPSDRGFAALMSDNTVRAWGSSYISVSDPNASSTATSPLTNIASIMPGKVAYFGVKKDGSFVAWGYYRGIVTGDDTAMNDKTQGLQTATIASLTNIKSIAATEGAYAVLKNDGTVIAFGDTDTGGDASSVQAQLTNVQQIAGTNYDFAARRNDGSVQTWYGAFGWLVPASGQNLFNVSNIVVNGSVGVAISNNGSASAFGDSSDIDAADSSALTGANALNNIKQIYATQTAFAALRSDGSVISWGDNDRMSASYQQISASLTNVVSVQSSEYAFAALKGNGTVVTWGEPGVGGDSSAVAPLLTNVVAITANKYAFAALKSDGSVVSWGMASKGGDSSAVASQLVNIRAVYATPLGAFLAVSKNGSLVTWGDPWAGGGALPTGLTKIPYTN